MSRLAGIAERASAGADQEERVGGGSGITKSLAGLAVIKMAKVVEAQSGAVGIFVEIETEDKQSARVTEWIQSGDAKNNSTTYTDKSGNQVNLPGLTKIKNLNFLLNGVFGLPAGEMKEIKEYDWELKQDVSAQREVITSWLNRPIGFCIQMTMEDKYNDETNFVTKAILEHFFDPVSDQFGSEKINSKPAENKQKFLDYIEKTPVKDRRDKSKGANAAPTANAGQSTATTDNAGF